MAKQKLFQITRDGNKLVVVYADETRETLDVEKLKESITDQLLFHGAKQKLADSAASAKGDLGFAKAAIGATIEALNGGEWTRRGGDATGGTILVEAIARIKGYDVATARQKLADLTKEERDNLKKSPTVKKVMLEIQAEKLAERDDEQDDDAINLV